MLFAHTGDVNLTALNAVKLAKVNILRVAADNMAVYNGEDRVVSADHGLEMARRIAADSAIGGQDVVVIIGSKGGNQLFQFFLNVHLQAGQALIDQDAGGSMSGDGEHNAVLDAGFLDGFEDILGYADQLKFLFADELDGSGFDHII